MSDIVDLTDIVDDISNIVFEGLVVILTFRYTWKEYKAIKLLFPSHSKSLVRLFLQQGKFLSRNFGQDSTNVDKVSSVSC